ncbi:MAG: hypothetical protein ABIK48_07230 [candidate division WOR-3 bacterium]
MENSFEILRTVNGINPQLPKNVVSSVYELSFLKMYLAWEWFLERTFILYMLGEKTDKGYSPNRYVNPRDEENAYDIIKGGARYPDWLSVDLVTEKAKIFFENGSPFVEALKEKANINDALKQMKHIRNMIVHISRYAKRIYEDLLRREFGSKRDLSPGEFLATIKKEEKIPYIAYYKKILEAASDEIVK